MHRSVRTGRRLRMGWARASPRCSVAHQHGTGRSRGRATVLRGRSTGGRFPQNDGSRPAGGDQSKPRSVTRQRHQDGAFGRPAAGSPAQAQGRHGYANFSVSAPVSGARLWPDLREVVTSPSLGGKRAAGTGLAARSCRFNRFSAIRLAIPGAAAYTTARRARLHFRARPVPPAKTR